MKYTDLSNLEQSFQGIVKVLMSHEDNFDSIEKISQNRKGFICRYSENLQQWPWIV